MKTKTRWKVVWHFVFIVVVFAMIYPIIFAISNSLKTEEVAYQDTISLFTDGMTFDNFIRLFERLPMFQIIGNTFIVSTVTTFLQIFCAFFAAYVLVYYTFKGSKSVKSLMMISMFVPFTVTMIPNYLMLARMDLLDNIAGVILPQVFSGSAMFLMVQAMRNIPLSLIEAARLDGVKDFAIMRDMVLPLIRPQLIATAIWFFTLSWNEFIWTRMILKTTENYTLPLALQMFISGEGGDGFVSAMAMSVVTMIIPLILYLIFQKYIIDTFISSGVK